MATESQHENDQEESNAHSGQKDNQNSIAVSCNACVTNSDLRFDLVAVWMFRTKLMRLAKFCLALLSLCTR